MTGRIICLGDTIIDVSLTVDAIPKAGSDILAKSGALFAGGTGFNVMTTASRLGIESIYAGMHGTGPFGDLARQAMKIEGIQLAHEPVLGRDTGWDVAITDSSAERTFMTIVGAEASLDSEHLNTVKVADEDAVYVSGYGLLVEPNGSAIEGWLSRTKPVNVVLTDPGPLIADIDNGLLDSVLANTTWLSCNEIEAELLSGESNPKEAADALVRRYENVIVRIGKDGCIVGLKGENPQLIRGFDVKAIDSNGAGDTHNGAFLAGLLQGLTPFDAAKRANAAAAIAVSRIGPATGPSKYELEKFLSVGR